MKKVGTGRFELPNGCSQLPFADFLLRIGSAAAFELWVLRGSAAQKPCRLNIRIEK